MKFLMSIAIFQLLVLSFLYGRMRKKVEKDIYSLQTRGDGMNLQEFNDMAIQQVAQKAKEDAEKICAKNEQTNEQEYDIIYT